MKTNPITPPPEVVDRLFMIEGSEEDRIIAAYRAGADQELEACCEWLEKDLDAYELVGLRAVYLDHNLHAARRPRPPSRKEQALEAISRLCASVIHDDLKDDAAIVLLALEDLDD